MNSLSSLDLIEIASPCPALWSEMTGDDRVRFCPQCRLNVYNLSEMSREEAEDFMRQRTAGQASDGAGRRCVRLYRRQDGTVLTKDCPVGVRALKPRFIRAAAAIAGLMIAMISGTLFGGMFNRLLPSGCKTPSEAFAHWIDPTARYAITGTVCPPGTLINPQPSKLIIDLTPAETPLLAPTAEQLEQIQQRLEK